MKKIVDGVIEHEKGALQYEMFEDQKTHEICFVEKYYASFSVRQYLAADVAQICRRNSSKTAREHSIFQRVHRSSCEGGSAVQGL